MVDLIILHWKGVTFVFYSFASVGLCYIFRNKLQNAVMQDTVRCRRQQVKGEEKVHFLVMLGLVVPVLILVLRLLLSDVMLNPAIAWGHFAALSYFYLLIHFYKERLLLPLFKSKAVSFVVWIGGGLETQIHKESVGCVAIVISLLLALLLYTTNVIPLRSPIFLFFMMGVYLSFRGIALTEGSSFYLQQVESIRNLGLTVGKFDTDDRIFVPAFSLLLLSGIMAVCLVGVSQTGPDLQGKGVFVKGSVTLKRLAVKGWDTVKALITTPW